MDGNSPRYEFIKPGSWPHKTVKDSNVKNAKPQPFVNEYKGKKSNRWRWYCENDIVLDVTFMLAKQIHELGLKDGDDLKIGMFKDGDKPSYKVKTTGGGAEVGELPQVGDGANSSFSEMKEALDSINKRLEKLEGKYGSESSSDDFDADEDIPF